MAGSSNKRPQTLQLAEPAVPVQLLILFLEDQELAVANRPETYRYEKNQQS
jgi:hypothetical protein